MTSPPWRRLRDRSFASSAAICWLAAASCGGDAPLPPIEPGPDPDRPAALTIHGGDGQTATTGTSVAEPLLVRVTGREGAALAGVQVSFAVASGGGRVQFATSNTDSGGLASPGRWTLGATGPQELRASVEGLEPVTFNATSIGIPARIEAVAGQGQRAFAGSDVAVAPLVRVTGREGAALAGVQVSFAVASGGGRVQFATSNTDSGGLASPGRWTLGATGPQELRASVEGLEPVTFNATSIGIPARIEAVAGQGQRAFAGSDVAVAPLVRVTAADGSPLSGILVSFTTGPGASIAGADSLTDGDGRAGAGRWTLGTRPDVYRLEAMADGESISGNPVSFEAQALAGPPAELLRIEGDGQESEVKFPVAVSPRVRVLDPHGNVMAGVTVSFEAGGGSAVVPAEDEADSLGFAGVDKWVLGPEPGVAYTLTASVQEGDDTLATTVFTATATPPVYDIEIVLRNPGALSESHRAAFENAERLWERAITGNLPWATLREAELRACLSRSGIDIEPVGDRLINDMLIYASVEDIDGRGGILAAAGPCQLRRDSLLPVAGTMRIDAADVDGDHLEETIVHEMAHVLGFGTLWGLLRLLQDSVAHGRGNPHFKGDSAVAAFARIGGERYGASELVPVQHLGGAGIWNGHWRDFVLCTELMTAFADTGENPLSIVSLASMIDLGYERVDLGVADAFEVPAGCTSSRAGARRPRWGPGGLAPPTEILLPPLGLVDLMLDSVHYSPRE